MKELILNALEIHNYFIGLHQLCRFLNDKGYIRFGCNAKYRNDINSKKKKTIKINPCKILCINSNIYLSKVYYWIKVMEKNKEIFTILIKYKDSKNPNSNIINHKTFDIFRFICLTKDIYLRFKKTNNLIEINKNFYPDKIN